MTVVQQLAQTSTPTLDTVPPTAPTVSETSLLLQSDIQNAVPVASNANTSHQVTYPGTSNADMGPSKCTTQKTPMAVLSHPLSPNQSSGSDTDPMCITTAAAAATALRRLYFKSGRNRRPKGPTVPMVVVMGTSTASEATINTSTDSASTLVTNVNSNTDTDATNDSLDLQEQSGQSEPLLSSLDEPASNSLSSLVSPRLLKGRASDQESLIGSPCTVYYQKRPLKHAGVSSSISDDDDLIEISGLDDKYPRTAPVNSSESKNQPSRFPFDEKLGSSSVRGIDKSHAKFTFEETNLHNCSAKFVESSSSTSSSPSSISANTVTIISPSKGVYGIGGSGGCGGEEERSPSRKDQRFVPPSGGGGASAINAMFNRVVFRDKICSKKRINSAPIMSSSSTAPGNGKLIDNTMFPFDREAIDYERIQRECFAVDESNESTSRYPFQDLDTDPDSPVYEKSSSIFHSPSKSPYRCNETNQNVHELKEMTPRGLYQQGCSGKDDIFRQYAILSQQESQCKSHGHGRERERRSPNMKRHKGSPQVADAFSPKPAKSRNSPGHNVAECEQELFTGSDTTTKFEQFNSKFEQMSPNQKRVSNCLSSNSNGNLHKSSNALSPTVQRYSPTVRVTPPLTELREDYLYSQNDSDYEGQRREKDHEVDEELEFEDFAESRRGSSLSRNKHKNLDRGGYTGKYQGTMTRNSSEEGTDDQSHQSSKGRGALDECQQQMRSINVTPNPMDGPVCIQQPRATIVVQQASLSLDHSVETLLLRESDFISVETVKQQQFHSGQENCGSSGGLSGSSRKTRKQRDDNMRQLLDVTNKFTNEEIRDFEMRYGSPHHRSQSVKNPRGAGRPNQLCLPQQRSRVASMPNTGVEEEYYRLRHFSITGKGVINRGDSLKSRRSRSNTSVASSNSSNEHLTTAGTGGAEALSMVLNGSAGLVGGGAGGLTACSPRTSTRGSLASSRESSTSNAGSVHYRVLMLGGAAVGKSSLVSQFMTSEYLHAYDTSIDDESGEKTVSVLLSGEESDLIFIDHSTQEMSPEKCLTAYDPHGYCVIYSSADRSSFSVAEQVLQGLWTSENIAQKAVILVANKADLARSRVVTSEEGKAMATAYDCKYIETSVGINHNVDELLVGLLSQIRLKLENPEKSRDLFRKRSYRKSKRRACSPLGGACLSRGTGGMHDSSPVNTSMPQLSDVPLSQSGSSAQSSPRKYRGSRTSASLKVKGLLGRVWARDSKSKSCENLHVL